MKDGDGRRRGYAPVVFQEDGAVEEPRIAVQSLPRRQRAELAPVSRRPGIPGTRRARPSPKSLNEYRGRWALVTGAAREQGLGYALARVLASAGIHLVLVDVLDEPLQRRAAQVRDEYGVEVRPVVCDLGEVGPYAALEQAVGGIDVDLLVCNHTFTPVEMPALLDIPIELHHRIVDVNARAYLNLTHRFGRPMRERRRGGIVLIASAAGLVGTAFTGAYSANKAFQIAMGEALWYELRPSQVDVLVVAAGLIRTHEEVLDRFPQWQMCEPDDAAHEIFSALGSQHLFTPGRANRFLSWLQMRVLGRRRAAAVTGDFMTRVLSRG